MNVISKIEITIIVIVLILFLLGAVLFFRSSLKKEGRWGANVNSPRRWVKAGVFKEVKCPSCGHQLKSIRQPQSISEFLWGGWTCPVCGTKIDKWGNEKV